MLRGSNSEPFQTGAIFERVRPRIATSGALTMGVNDVPPMPPSDEMVKVAPYMSPPFSSPSRARALEIAQLLGDLDDALAVGILDDRNDEAVGRVGGEADVVVVLADQLVAIGVER